MVYVGIERCAEGAKRGWASLSCVDVWTYRANSWRVREHIQWL